MYESGPQIFRLYELSAHGRIQIFESTSVLRHMYISYLVQTVHIFHQSARLIIFFQQPCVNDVTWRELASCYVPTDVILHWPSVIVFGCNLYVRLATLLRWYTCWSLAIIIRRLILYLPSLLIIDLSFYLCLSYKHILYMEINKKCFRNYYKTLPISRQCVSLT